MKAGSVQAHIGRLDRRFCWGITSFFEGCTPGLDVAAAAVYMCCMSMGRGFICFSE